MKAQQVKKSIPYYSRDLDVAQYVTTQKLELKPHSPFITTMETHRMELKWLLPIPWPNAHW